jgi:hypothetical protein
MYRFFADLAKSRRKQGLRWYKLFATRYLNNTAHENGQPLIAKVIRFPAGPIILQWLGERPEIKVGQLALSLDFLDKRHLLPIACHLLQIIFLVRDPRAIYNSRLKMPYQKSFIRDPERFCTLVWGQLQILQQLGSDQ